MKNENDMDLDRLFSQIPEAEPDEVFVARVSKRIVRRRRAHVAVKMLCAVAGLVILAGLMPGLIDLTWGIAVVSDLLSRAIVTLALSPFGWAIGGGTGLFYFFRMRS